MSERPFPAGLLAAALLFWGWQSEQAILAALLALVLEAQRLTPWRWELGVKDFNRMLDLGLLLLAGTAVYLFLTPEGEGPAASFGLGLTLWAPLCAFPLVLTQIYSVSGRVPLAALRPFGRRPPGAEPVTVDLRYAYFLCCLFGAGAANTRNELFFPSLALLLGWLAWRFRPRRYPAWAWLACFSLACGIGYLGQKAIDDVQAKMRGWSLRESYRRSTSIGDVGKVKQSDAVVARVLPEPPSTSPPLLLREASYNFFNGREWLGTDSEFKELASEREGSWAPHPGEPASAVRVYMYFPRRVGLLLTPTGTLRVEDMPARRMEANRLGALRVVNAPGLAGYRALYDNTRGFDAAPDLVDKTVPPSLRAATSNIIQELRLDELPSAEALAALKAHFAARFTYTLTLQRTDISLPPIAEFLLSTRSGHCEYFATAAVFILRAAGIPARYATGYSIQEFSPGEKVFLLREKHAHAWVLAFVDGAWREFDPTPPVWFELERSPDTLWTRLADLRSRVSFAFARWRWLEEKSGTKRALLWSALGLGLFLVYRLARRRGVARVKNTSPVSVLFVTPGADSEFSEVAARLAREHGRRRQGETLGQWLSRIGWRERLAELLALHNRYRFDPAGLNPERRAALREAAARWLSGPRRK
jgi:transglutaminase-like putative cysteine protease